MRKATRERCAIGLERGIRPATLILHLKEVALEIELRLHAIVDIDDKVAERGKERDIHTVLKSLRADFIRQIAAHLAIGRLRSIWLARAFAIGMQDAETDTIVAKIGTR